MSKVGLVLVTHAGVGRVLLDTASAIMGPCPLSVELLPVPLDSDPEQTAAEARRLGQKVNSGGGVLVLTDMYGSTPGNIACHLLKGEDVRVVSGLNLPMLLRIFNYPQLALQALAEKAAAGGKDGVLLCAGERTQSHGQ